MRFAVPGYVPEIEEIKAMLIEDLKADYGLVVTEADLDAYGAYIGPMMRAIGFPDYSDTQALYDALIDHGCEESSAGWLRHRSSEAALSPAGDGTQRESEG